MTSIGVYATESWEAGRIAEEAKRWGIEVYPHEYKDFSENWITPDIGIFRTVVDRTVGENNVLLVKKIAARIEDKGGYVFNQTATEGYPKDKQEQARIFRKAGLPAVPELNPAGEIEFPVIVKPKGGSLGLGIAKVNSNKELSEVLKNSREEMLIQEMMETGVDYRVIVLGGKVLGAMQRKAAEGQITANFSRGGSVKAAELSTEQYNMATEAAKAMKLEYAGVDLIRDRKGDWKVLEVNRCAQFRGFEQATKVNVAKKIVEYSLHQYTK